ncbi:Conserved oligomeric Golgi complex, subunit 4 [Artemisia annua]|uniref:Conserved oligomeric Golgi complex, subunit 4 n=1 Tax=Artemisia annua TaxID=35608 RepID=A0A2U1KCP5_ARTAN|nr:Conserved oligomeric Golgi complex, subunit 4 [Artemisia annua]
MQKTRIDIATVLNNMDVSSEYALKLRHEIEEQCANDKLKISKMINGVNINRAANPQSKLSLTGRGFIVFERLVYLSKNPYTCDILTRIQSFVAGISEARVVLRNKRQAEVITNEETGGTRVFVRLLPLQSGLWIIRNMALGGLSGLIFLRHMPQARDISFTLD